MCSYQPQLLLRIIDAHKMDQALIFVRTRLDADNLQKFLSGIHGQGKHERGKSTTLYPIVTPTHSYIWVSQGMLQEEYSCLVLHSGAGQARTYVPLFSWGLRKGLLILKKQKSREV